MTADQIINEGRRFPLAPEAAERHFMILDAINRTHCRGPKVGPVDERHPIEKIMGALARSGQPVAIGGR